MRCAASTGATTAPAEEFFKDASTSAAAEGFSEDIKGIVPGESTATTTSAAHASLCEGSMAVTVVGRTFLLVFQNVVGFGNLFEFCFGLGIARVFIRVVFDREFAVGLLQLISRSIA